MCLFSQYDKNNLASILVLLGKYDLRNLTKLTLWFLSHVIGHTMNLDILAYLVLALNFGHFGLS